LLRVHRCLLLSAHNKKLGLSPKGILHLGLANGFVQHLLRFGVLVQGNQSPSFSFVRMKGKPMSLTVPAV